MRLRVCLAALLATAFFSAASIQNSSKPTHGYDPHQTGTRPFFAAQGITTTSEHPEPSVKKTASQRQCASFVRIRELQGELYLGHVIQEKILSRNCPSDYRRLQTKFWRWPWHNGKASTELPPYRHSQHEDWVIQCGLAGRDRRCILAHHATSPTDKQVEVITHFAFHRSGKTHELIWRIWAVKKTANWYAGRTPADNLRLQAWSNKCQKLSKKNGGCKMQERYKLFKSLNTERVIYSQSGKHDFLKFNVCQEEGCMAEASGPNAQKVSKALIRNESLTLTLSPLPDHPVGVAISPNGFSEAIITLSQLWQEDQGPLAGSVKRDGPDQSANY